MSFSTILFDLDGTLTDPAEGITKSVSYALDAYGFEHGTPDTLKFFIGPPLLEQFMQFTNTNREFGEKLVNKYREYYSVYGIYENKVYDGIPAMLEKLKESGKTVVLATSKPEKFAKIILEHFNLTRYFDFIAGAAMDNSRTKKSDVIRYALAGLSHMPDTQNTVMVGDRHHDIDGAHECGLKCIGVTFGYGSLDELKHHNADFIADSVSSLEALLFS